MANSSISVTEGSGKNIGTYSISETTTKELQRVSLNTSAGVELGTSGAPVRVDPTGTTTQPVSLATGTNSFGKISDITTSITPGTGAANLGKAEDAVAADGDVGVMALGVRNDALASKTGSNGDYTQITVDQTGKVVTSPYAPEGARASGTATVTGTSDTSVVAASGSGSLKLYITSAQIVNTGSTTSLITFKNGSGGSTLAYSIAPTGGGSNILFPVPLVTSANTALYFAAASSSTTIYVSAQGYYAP